MDVIDSPRNVLVKQTDSHGRVTYAPDYYCNAEKSPGVLCENRAGKGTDHVGTGRCSRHGGSTLRGVDHPNFKHGGNSIYARYTTDKLADKLEQLAEVDVFDLAPEAQLLRALLLNTLEAKGDVLLPADLALVADLIERVSRVVEKVSRIRNDTAFTVAEVAYIAQKMQAATEFVPEDKRAAYLEFVFSMFPGMRD